MTRLTTWAQALLPGSPPLLLTRGLGYPPATAVISPPEPQVPAAPLLWAPWAESGQGVEVGTVLGQAGRHPPAVTGPFPQSALTVTPPSGGLPGFRFTGWLTRGERAGHSPGLAPGPFSSTLPVATHTCWDPATFCLHHDLLPFPV